MLFLSLLGCMAYNYDDTGDAEICLGSPGSTSFDVDLNWVQASPLDPTVILDELKQELVRRGRLIPGGAPSDPLQLAVLLTREYMRYPIDNARASVARATRTTCLLCRMHMHIRGSRLLCRLQAVPLNFCALPWVLGQGAWYARALRAALSPWCEDVPPE